MKLNPIFKYLMYIITAVASHSLVQVYYDTTYLVEPVQIVASLYNFLPLNFVHFNSKGLG